MLSSTRPSVPPRPHRSVNCKQIRVVEPKSPELGAQREDINMNTTANPATSSHQGYVNNTPAESVRSRADDEGHATVGQSRGGQQKCGTVPFKTHKPSGVHLVSDPSPTLDPNCNEPSLPCLCCNGYSPQDNNSTYNLNYINNNTVGFRQEIQQTQHSDEELHQRGAYKAQKNPKAEQLQLGGPAHKEGSKTKEDELTDSNAHGDDGDVDEDDGLIPSCWDCPPSLLEFSLSSFPSSSSTSISGCSDLESDCPDAISLSCQDLPPEQSYTVCSSAAQPQTILLESHAPHPSIEPPCTPREGHPSAHTTPSDSTEGESPSGQEDAELDVQDLSDSVDDFGKASPQQAVQMSHWDMESYVGLGDGLDHLERLEKMSKEREFSHPSRPKDSSLGEADPAEEVNTMGDLDIPVTGGCTGNALDFSDTLVNFSASLIYNDPPDSLSSSPLQSPPQPSKLSSRHTDMQTFTYMNMNASTPSPPTVSSGSSSSPSFSSTSASSSSPPCVIETAGPSLPPPPAQPIPYFTFHSSIPSLSSVPPPIPPPRRRRLARLEAERNASRQLENTTPPVPPPPSRALPPPPPLPSAVPSAPAPPRPSSSLPPPSFHVLDDEIRKLLALAGITQAELLKLSPELGVGVMELLEPEGKEVSEAVRPSETNTQETRDRKEGRQGGGRMQRKGDVYREGDREDSASKVKGSATSRISTEEQAVKESRETLRTTSFTDMARSRKGNSFSNSSSRNCGYSPGDSLESYYSAAQSDASNPNPSCRDNNTYTSIKSSSPPPPPSAPLTHRSANLPTPPPLPCGPLATWPNRTSQPEHFDWLIAFSPDIEALSGNTTGNKEVKKSPQKSAVGSKVTTFKELRSQGRQNPQPALILPEPDPTVMTPDPDFLYSLKWKTEYIDGDGRQWEYTPQAPTSSLQPPSETSVAVLKEVLPAPRRERVPRPSDLAGCSACECRLQTAASERGEEEAALRGRADGGRSQESRAAVCSLSFAETAERGGAWRAHLSAQGPYSPCLQGKRALLSPVSVAVDAILAQFSSSRTLVQKVQSGDSRVNPSLGRLVLQCLCPALLGLLSDGLKPHQTDLIAGRRPNSPWGLVQASTRPGPSTQALYSLQCQVSQLPQLRQNRHRFNAFLLGLLNIKLLDHWINHLQSCDDLLESHYLPTSFMWLSRSSCQPLFDELLLLLQPLSLLTFNLDLLFQHHHFDPASPTPPSASYSSKTPSPANQACGFRTKGLSFGRSAQFDSTAKQGSGSFTNNTKANFTAPTNNSSDILNRPFNGRLVLGAAAATMEEAANKLPWRKENEIVPPSVCTLSQQAGQAIQQGWGAIMRWGGQFGHNWGSYNKAEGMISAGAKSSSLGQDLWPSSTLTESDFISHKPVQGPPPECNSVTPWVLERLFGTSRGQRASQTEKPLTRHPCHWLAPGGSVLPCSGGPAQSSVNEGRGVESEGDHERAEMRDYLRSVRTQRDHRARGQLY